MSRTITGRQKSWQILEQIGKGDAGEVLRVQAELGHEAGLMKRPVQNVSGGTILRQAVQIENEGKILAKLSGLDASRNNLIVHTPLLLDQSISGTSQTASFFIISEEVKGIAIENLLKQLYQEKISISQVLVLKVLSSLFFLLSKIHAMGIIWNDVKMEHIFWNENSNTLSFIDWGNGQFFDISDEATSQTQELLDYEQLISEGNLLLNQIAPELIPEIGWPANNSSLSKQELIHLQHRVEYMESYLSMRVVEYQVLFRKYLQKITDLETLKDLFELKNSLEKLGVQVDRPAMLASTLSLAVSYAQVKNYSLLKKLVSMVREYLTNDFGDNWNMAEYLLSVQEAYAEPGFSDLLSVTLQADWSQALWQLQIAQNQTKNLPYLRSTQMAMRKSANIVGITQEFLVDQLKNLADEAHLQIIRSQTHSTPDDPSQPALENFSFRLDQILKDWQVLVEGEMLGDKFLELRTLLSSQVPAFLEAPASLLHNLNTLLAKTREIFVAWSEGDLVKTKQALQDLFLLEPSLTYLQELYSAITNLEKWLESLSTGPVLGQSITTFAKQLLHKKTAIAARLSQPTWLGSLYACADALAAATDIEAVRSLAREKEWPIPWIEYIHVSIDLPIELGSSARLNQDQLVILAEYHQALKNQSGIAAALHQIKSSLPEFHPLYANLAEAFDQLFTTLPIHSPAVTVQAFPCQDQEAVQQAYSVLEYVRLWKENLSSGHPLARPVIPNQFTEWQIVQEIEQTQKTWENLVLPTLTDIRQRQWDKYTDLQQIEPPLALLYQSCRYLAKLSLEWSKIPTRGIFTELVQELIFLADKAHENFFSHWQAGESDPQKSMQWLVRTYQSTYSSINQTLLQVSRHLRTVVRSLDVVNKPEMARTRLAQNSAGDLMFALVQLERLIQPATRKPSKIQEWQAQYSQILKQTDWQATVREIETTESVHPLLPWFDELVRRDVDFISASENQKW